MAAVVQSTNWVDIRKLRGYLYHSCLGLGEPLFRYFSGIPASNLVRLAGRKVVRRKAENSTDKWKLGSGENL